VFRRRRSCRSAGPDQHTHHHFYQTLTRATPEALDRPLFGWLTALYSIWGRITPEAIGCPPATVALSELLLSGCTTTTDHHYATFLTGALITRSILKIAAAQRLGIPHNGDPRLDESVATRTVGLPPDGRSSRTRTRSSPTASDLIAALPSALPRCAGSQVALRTVLAVQRHHVA